jgi:hypothetical protein
MDKFNCCELLSHESDAYCTALDHFCKQGPPPLPLKLSKTKSTISFMTDKSVRDANVIKYDFFHIKQGALKIFCLIEQLSSLFLAERSFATFPYF